MKKIIALIIITFSFFEIAHAQNVGINASGSLPDSSAILDVSSVTKGFLPPRMTLAQRNLISGPATGIIIYQTDDVTGLYCNQGTPASSNWQLIGPVAPLSYGYFSGNGTQISSSFPQPLFLTTVNAADGITVQNNSTTAVVTKTGLYRIAYQLTMESSNNSTAFVNIAVNGVNTSSTDSRQVLIASSNTTLRASMSDERIIMLNAGDAVSITFSATGNTSLVRCSYRSLFITQMR